MTRGTRRPATPSIAVVGMAPEQGRTLGFRATAAEFRQLMRDYTDDPAGLLAEARAWPMSVRIYGGEVFAHGLEPARGEVPWRDSRRRQPRVTLIEAPTGPGRRPTYRILTRSAFVTAMAAWWTDSAAWFDWLVANRGWRTDESVSAYGGPLVWVEGDARKSVVEELARLRDRQDDTAAAPSDRVAAIAADRVAAIAADRVAALEQVRREEAGRRDAERRDAERRDAERRARLARPPARRTRIGVGTILGFIIGHEIGNRD